MGKNVVDQSTVWHTRLSMLAEMVDPNGQCWRCAEGMATIACTVSSSQQGSSVRQQCCNKKAVSRESRGDLVVAGRDGDQVCFGSPDHDVLQEGHQPHPPCPLPRLKGLLHSLLHPTCPSGLSHFSAIERRCCCTLNCQCANVPAVMMQRVMTVTSMTCVRSS